MPPATTGPGEVNRGVGFEFTLIPEQFDSTHGGAPEARGQKTKLKPCRITQGIYENGDNFQETDDWQIDGHLDITHGEHGRLVSHLWTGRTIFLVDRQYSKEYGTDQRRQRATVANRINTRPRPKVKI